MIRSSASANRFPGPASACQKPARRRRCQSRPGVACKKSLCTDKTSPPISTITCASLHMLLPCGPVLLGWHTKMSLLHAGPSLESRHILSHSSPHPPTPSVPSAAGASRTWTRCASTASAGCQYLTCLLMSAHSPQFLSPSVSTEDFVCFEAAGESRTEGGNVKWTHRSGGKPR